MHCESGRVDDQVSFSDHPFAGGGKLSDVVQPPLPAGHLELIMLNAVPKGQLVPLIQMIMRSTVPSLRVCPAEWTLERNTAACGLPCAVDEVPGDGLGLARPAHEGQLHEVHTL